MAAAILATKLYIPSPRPGIVPRPRLIERLNEGLAAGRKLALISAPAGFGKTTLISEWIAGCGRPVAWLSLDEGDNDSVRFLSYLIAALQTILGGIDEGLLAVLQSPQPPSTESILTALLNDITTLPDDFILALDDYHVIDSKQVDQALAFLVEHQPPHMHLVITTREDPSLPLARLRARGQLIELRAADLRFTPAEAAEFLNQVMGLSLSAADIAALETRTEGWIAGLQLAAISMQGHPDTTRFIQSFTGSHRFVLDYLVEEVLQRQSTPSRSFLLQTAILDRFCAPLCNAVVERDDSKGMLDALERSNLFLIPLDDQRQWYRYHHLFADVLQSNLLEAQPDRVAALHLRASVWYEQNGLRSDAINHALAAKDFALAAGLIELAWPEAEQGSIQIATWLGWVKTLPDELIHARPALSVWFAYALLGRGEMEAAQARLQDAERWLEPVDTLKAPLEAPSTGTSPDRNRKMVFADQQQIKSLPAAIAVARAYIAQALGNVPDTVKYASRVLELASEGDHLRHGQASMLLGMTHWASGDLGAANRVFADYTMKLRAAGNIPDAISTTVVLAEIRLALGRLQEAIITIEHLLVFVMDQGEPISPDTADLHRELSELYLEQGNLEAAAQHVKRSKDLGEKAMLPVWRYRWCIAQARLNETQGDLDGALALLDEAERLFIRTPLPDLHPISAMKARIWVAQGRLTEALGWAYERSLSTHDDLSYLREFEHITLARILIAQYQSERIDGSIHTAMRLLDRLLQAAEEGGRMGGVIEILVLQALAHQAIASKEGNTITPALGPLERALTLAEPEGYVRIFLDGGEPIQLLVADYLLRIEKQKCNQNRRLAVFTDKLLAAFLQPMTGPELITAGEVTLNKQKPETRNQQSTMIESLSERELEVLRLLRTELNGPGIARECMVSLNTVRTHTQHIYAKLGVNNRRAAVRRAEELNLL